MWKQHIQKVSAVFVVPVDANMCVLTGLLVDFLCLLFWIIQQDSVACAIKMPFKRFLDFEQVKIQILDPLVVFTALQKVRLTQKLNVC